MRGYKPKDAVGLMLQELEIEYRSDPTAMEQARGHAESFLRKVREGFI
jgi:hypothetical protein